MQKKQHEKVVKSKVAAQKWLWWFDNGKTLMTTIRGILCCRFTNLPELLLLKIL